MNIQITKIENGYLMAFAPQNQGESHKLVYLKTLFEVAACIESIGKMVDKQKEFKFTPTIFKE